MTQEKCQPIETNLAKMGREQESPIILFTFHGAEFDALQNAGISAVMSKDKVDTDFEICSTRALAAT